MPHRSETKAAQAFYAGRYAEVVEATFDNPAGFSDADVGFAVGALTFVDRREEAIVCFEAWRARTNASDLRTRIMSQFMIGLAFARSGQFARSAEWLVTHNVGLRHRADQWGRALIFQGLACQRFFSGHLAAAERNALRSLHAAHRAAFPYATLLSTDLRGHALIQLGHLERGGAVLAQARRQAQKLRLDKNVYAIDCSLAAYQALFRPTQDSLDRLDELLKKKSHDSYSQRSLLNERAVLLAMRGQRADALASLALADARAMRSDTRRAKLVNLIARLRTMRFTHGAAQLSALVEQAMQLADESERTYRAQTLSFDALNAEARGDTTRAEATRRSLFEIVSSNRSFLAKAAYSQFAVGETGDDPFAEDQLTPLLRGVNAHDLRVLPRLLGLGLFGMLPELLGLQPASRIIVLPAEDLVVIESEARVLVRERPPRWVPVLLRALGKGEGRKEQIAARLWGRVDYHPLRHDPPVRTTIHRLRAFLAPFGDFVQVNEEGYSLRVPVHVAGELSVPETTGPLWDRDEAPALERTTAVSLTQEKPSHEDVVLERLRELEHASVSELARSLHTSQSTVLRALRVLVEDRRVVRTGKARATRYWPKMHSTR